MNKNNTALQDQNSTTKSVGRFRATLFVLFWIAFIVSGINPSMRVVWFFQIISPVLLMSLLFSQRKKFLPSIITSFVIWIQCLLLLVGAHYRYHLIPVFRLQLPDGTTRGYVDWIVHFIDGFVFSLIARDILSQFSYFTSKKLFRIVIVLASLGLAALWEITEWIALVISKDAFSMYDNFSADSYVDMGLSLLGSLLIIYWIKPVKLHSNGNVTRS